jgi:alkylation response protein AidB-like acyl-CoA dehydrogenase
VGIAKTSINTGVFLLVFKIHTIFEGTSEIQQLVIARAISGLRIE